MSNAKLPRLKAGDAIRFWEPKTMYLPGEWSQPCLVRMVGPDGTPLQWVTSNGVIRSFPRRTRYRKLT